MFPSVTICIQRQSKFSYCGIDILGDSYPYNINMQDLCPRNSERKTAMETSSADDPLSKYAYWTNDQSFEFSCPESRSCSPSDFQKQFFKTVSNERGECVSWNGNGTYHNLHNLIELTGKVLDRSFNKYPTMEIIIHEPQIDGTLQERSFSVMTGRKYEISFTKIVTELLPAPYSNCVDKKKDDIFPGKYTVGNCFDSHDCISTLMQCGDTFDYCRKYVPKKLTTLYKRNNTIIKTIDCFRKRNVSLTHSCLLPCTRTDYEISVFSENDLALKRNELYKIYILYIYKIYIYIIYILIILISEIER